MKQLKVCSDISKEGIAAVAAGLMTLMPGVALAATTPGLILAEEVRSEDLDLSLDSLSVELAQALSRDSSSVSGRLDSNSKKLEDGSYFNIHTFEGEAGEQITIEVSSRDLELILGLLDPEGNRIALDKSSGEGDKAKITVTLPTTGSYQIGVISSQAGEISEYTLSWREATAKDLQLAEAKRLSQQQIQLYQEGQYAAAIPLAQKVLAIFEKILGESHPHVAASLNNLAQLYSNQGDYGKAEPLYLRSLEIREKVLGESHPDVTTSLNNLAGLYSNQGDYGKAEPLYLRSLEIREKVLGESHPHVAASLNNLAQLYSNQGDYGKAEPLYLRSLEIREKVLGESHPHVAASLNNLAGLHSNQGDYAKAEPLYLRSLEIREKVLGESHPDVANSLNNLAALYQDQGDYGKAEPLYLRSLEIREKVLGESHPDVAESLNNLAVLYSNQGDYAKAEPLSLRSLEIREKVLGESHPDVANSLNTLAVLYDSQGDYAKAEPLYLRSLEIREKVLGESHPRLATSLNNLAVLYVSQGDYAKAEPLYLRSLEIREKVLGESHPDVAASLNNLAFLYDSQGDYGKAEPLYLRSLEIREKVLGESHPDVAESLNNLAELYKVQGDYGKAEPLLLRSLEIREKALGESHPDVATSLNNLAGLYQDQGDYVKAEPLYLRSLEIMEKVLGESHPDVANSLNNLAVLYQDQGDYEKAEPLYLRSLEIREQVLGESHPDVATSLNNLAFLYSNQGDYAKAEPLYLRSLEIREQVLGESHPDVAESLNNLARLYDSQGDYEKAKPLYLRSLEIREKVLGESHPDVATSLNNLAAFYYSQGDYGKAEPLYLRSLEIFQQVLGESHPDVAESFNNLAAFYYSQGDYEKAKPLFLRSLEIREKVLGKSHPDLATSLNNLAFLYSNQGDYGKAEPLYLRSLEIFQQALGESHPNVATSLNNLAMFSWTKGDIFPAIEFQTRAANIQEKNLSLIFKTGSERQKRAYMATLSGETNATISLHLQAAPNNPEAANLAFTTILRRKGRVLDALTESLQLLRENLTPENQALLDELAETRSQLATLIFQGAGNSSPEQYKKQVSTLKAELEELEAELSRKSAEFRTQSEAVTIEKVQQLITEDTALLELVLYKPFNLKDRKFGEPRYVAYILHPSGEPKWVDLGEAEPIDALVAEFRNLLQYQSPTVKQTARQLDKLVMEPIRKLLGDTTNILISPDSQLNLIPFAALVDENNNYLVENYRFTYLTTGRDLLRLQLDYASQQFPALIANPDYENPGNTPNLEVATARTRETNRATDITNLSFNPLPGTAEEATTIASILPGVTLFTKSLATENTLKGLKSPNILHIATHGFFLEDVEIIVAPIDFNRNRSLFVQPVAGIVPRVKIENAENPLLRSGLALAGANPKKSGNEDGILTALEAAGLSLRGTKLVVLSACETGVGEVANGEGVYGLRRAFVMAGAESLLFSLWLVDDFGTKDLMIDYYQRVLNNNEGRSEALRQVQLTMLGSKKYNHPYYWAAFIPSGDGRPIVDS